AASLTREEAVSALRACGGNVSRAARKLSIGRKTLYRRIADWEIDVGALRPGGS
ncbi:MAG: helix-turn-helix domain-containing protein, partial [Proteobacteria bacterium]|nr:helix-turn-helix domain-containing protein [Pseudomonadota bacterium]